MDNDKEYVIDFFKRVIDKLDDGVDALVSVGMPRKTANDIDNFKTLIPKEEYADFVDWLYTLIYPDKWQIIESDKGKRIHLDGEANYDRPLSYGGISKCFRAGMRKFVDYSLISAHEAESAGYMGYKEAVTLVNTILSGDNTYFAWRAFSKASHRYGRKALCATLLAGSDEWEDACNKIMKMPTL